jgi:diguanylate cyclase (GGDEF)-like protein/PAS domain S-box-containing protein
MRSFFSRYKIEGAFLSAIAILLVAGFLSYRALLASGASAGWVQHTYEVLDNLDQLSGSIAVVESSSRGFALTGDDAYLQPFQAAIAEAQKCLARVSVLTRDNPEQHGRVPVLSRLTAENLESAGKLIGLRRSQGLDAATRVLKGDANRASLENFQAAVNVFKSLELELLEDRRAKFARDDALTKWVLLFGTGLGILITASAGIGTVRDTYLRRRAEAELHVQKELAQVTLGSIADGVIRVDTRGDVTFLNRPAELMTGYSAHEALGQPFKEIFHLVDSETGLEVINRMQRAVESGHTTRLPANALLVHREGAEIPIEDHVAPIHDRDGQIAGAVMVFRDVSAAREATKRLEHTAQHDALTGLPNRALLDDRLERAISLATRQMTRLAVLFLDLDGFKPINDRHGHAMGDKLLQSVTLRLCACVRDCDTVSRLGGDEFVVLLNDIADPEDAAGTARRILRDISKPHVIAGKSLRVTASLGISMHPEDGNDVDTLLKHADMAMYEAKAGGRNEFAFYSDTMRSAQIIDVASRIAAVRR